jgi:hypothetical protein
MIVGFHENRCCESRGLLYLGVYMCFSLCFPHLVSVLGAFRYKSSENDFAERLRVPKKIDLGKTVLFLGAHRRTV